MRRKGLPQTQSLSSVLDDFFHSLQGGNQVMVTCLECVCPIHSREMHNCSTTLLLKETQITCDPLVLQTQLQWISFSTAVFFKSICLMIICIISSWFCSLISGLNSLSLSLFFGKSSYLLFKTVLINFDFGHAEPHCCSLWIFWLWCPGFHCHSCCGAWSLGHRLSTCAWAQLFMGYRIFPDQGLNLSPVHWQAGFVCLVFF